MNMTEKRRAERMLTDTYEGLKRMTRYNYKQYSDPRQSDPPASIRKRIERIEREVAACREAGYEITVGYSWRVGRGSVEAQMLPEHPLVQKFEAERQEAIQRLDSDLEEHIRAVWAGTIDFPAVYEIIDQLREQG